MNKKSLLFVLPLIALVLMSCQISGRNVIINRETISGSGNLKTETRPARDIERVSLEDQGNLTIIQGDKEGLTVEADDNLLPYLETNMRGRELVIKVKDGYSISRGTIRYTLNVKSLNRISVAGAANVSADKLSVGDLALDVAGTGNMHFADLQAEDLRAQVSGAGNFDLKGKVKSQSISIAGAGQYAAGDLQSGPVDVTVSGSGNVTVWPADSLTVRITGFGNVSYYGTPKITQSITGGGEVKSLGEHK